MKPGGSEAKRSFLAELDRAGFSVLGEAELTEGDVQCTMWTCERA